MPTLMYLLGRPITAYPEPLRSALIETFAREWTGPADPFSPSPLLAALLAQAERRCAGQRERCPHG